MEGKIGYSLRRSWDYMNIKKANRIFLLSVTLITFTIILKGYGDFSKLMGQTNIRYLEMAMMMMVIDWLFDGFILNIITETVHGNISYFRSLRIAIIGQYYNAITPFSTGGQPVQVYLMSKDNISVTKGSTILFNKFIIYQMAVTFYSLTMLVSKIGFILNDAKAAIPFIAIGFLVNLVILVGIILLFYKPQWIRPIIVYCYKGLYKIKIIKDLNKHIDKLDTTMEEYEQSLSKVKENRATSIKLFLLTLIQLTCYFSITYFVYMALGLEGASFLDIIAVQSLVYMAASYIPTPGTAGASEGGYYILFKPLFTKNFIGYALLLWRSISYYFRLIITGLVALIDTIIRNRKAVV